VKAIVRGIQGAHEAPRWRHLLALAGLLLGFSVNTHLAIAADVRSDLEAAVARAANLALEEEEGKQDSIGAGSIALVLGLTFPIVGQDWRRTINSARSLATVEKCILFSPAGLDGAAWIGLLEKDFVGTPETGNYTWNV
jgi:hypothetical protein